MKDTQRVALVFPTAEETVNPLQYGAYDAYTGEPIKGVYITELTAQLMPKLGKHIRVTMTVDIHYDEKYWLGRKAKDDIANLRWEHLNHESE
jgi:hypothetical protein